ncbi:hypothetical protein AB0A76_28250 [Streptomyces exfoliatus]|uniref:Uncharacterized protein n=1 Tax=Streptomyces exfoliatus TaxID=1905 RepID=A0ABV3D3P7_STREX
MAGRTPAQVLAESRRQTSLLKRQRVFETVRRMLNDSEPISFTAVARAAGVSTWLVYAEGVREHVQTAIQRQERAPATEVAEHRTPKPVAESPEPAGQVVDLMAALEKSVAEARERRGETGPADGAEATVHDMPKPKKTTAKKTTPKKTPAKKTAAKKTTTPRRRKSA